MIYQDKLAFAPMLLPLAARAGRRPPGVDLRSSGRSMRSWPVADAFVSRRRRSDPWSWPAPQPVPRTPPPVTPYPLVAPGTGIRPPQPQPQPQVPQVPQKKPVVSIREALRS